MTACRRPQKGMNVLELPILGLLKEEPLHGYELKKRLDEGVAVVAGVSYGSLYPALRRLERMGAIEALDAGIPTPIPATGSIGGETAAARWAERPGAEGAESGEVAERSRRPASALRRRLTTSRRKRKEYRITDRGHELLDELLRAGEDAGDGRAFALKLAFCRYLPPEDRLVLFERRREWLADKLARARGAMTVEGGRRRRADGYTRSLIEHDGESTRRDLEWVERLIAEERGRHTEISGAPGAEQPA